MMHPGRVWLRRGHIPSFTRFYFLSKTVEFKFLHCLPNFMRCLTQRHWQHKVHISRRSWGKRSYSINPNSWICQFQSHSVPRGVWGRLLVWKMLLLSRSHPIFFLPSYRLQAYLGYARSWNLAEASFWKFLDSNISANQVQKLSGHL